MSGVALVLAGELRGDVRTWSNIKMRLVSPHGTTTYGAFWRPHIPSAALACFRCVWEPEPLTIREYDAKPDGADWRWYLEKVGSSVTPSHPLANHSLRDRVLPQYYLVFRAFQLAARGAHRVLVRCRTDVLFELPVPLTLRSPSSVHLEGGEWEYRPSFLADYGEASCGRMPNDWFAYGTPAVMMQYSRLLLDLPDTYVSMTEDKALRSARLGVRQDGLRRARTKYDDPQLYRSGNLTRWRPDGTFLDNQEGMLGAYLRRVRVGCALVYARARLCWRSKVPAPNLSTADFQCSQRHLLCDHWEKGRGIAGCTPPSPNRAAGETTWNRETNAWQTR